MRRAPRSLAGLGSLAGLVLWPAITLAAPGPKPTGGQGHEHARGHDHDHDHPAVAAGEVPPEIVAARKPLVGDWQLDVDATLDALPGLAPAIARQGRAAVARDLRRAVGDVRMSFLPDGGLFTAGADGIKRGLYAVEGSGDAMTVYAYDIADNRLATSEYTARVDGDRLRLTHAGDTMVFARATATARDERLVGRWLVDPDRTLMADPRQRRLTAEQRKTTRDALRAFFGGIAFRFAADGRAESTLGGETMPGTWRVLGREGDRLDVEIEHAKGTERMQIDLDGDFMRLMMTSQKDARPLVLHREK